MAKISISISFGNLGISLGTFTSGFFIASYGVEIIPWIMFSFGVSTLIVMVIKSYIQKRQRPELTPCVQTVIAD